MDEIVVTAKRLPKHALSDAGAFYTAVRKITGPLDTEQVRTIDGLLTGASHWPLGWMAYGLATAWHEARLKPIEEWGKGAKHKYGKPGKYGQAPYGRGLVQLTWDFNYEWADGACSEAGIIRKGEILADFSLVMRPDIAAFILIEGMESGKFTGKSLATYLTGWRGTVPQFVNARRVINGTDKRAKIAGEAVDFQDALAEGGWV